MANFKAVVRRQRKDGFWQVYIRVTHHRNAVFIKTNKMVTSKELTKDNEIKDPFVLKYCSELIIRYNEKLNKVDASMWTQGQVVEYLTNDEDDVCFSEYAHQHIGRMINRGQERNAKNYKLALQHLERFFGTTKVMFSYFTSNALLKWFASLEHTNRAKEMYPTCIRQIYKAALVELNDEELGIIRIKYNPWLKVQIPHAERSTQLAISAEECREFFNCPLPVSKFVSSVPEIGRDVAKLVLCLGGINTIDLFNMKKENYKNGILCYNRAKTMHSRADKAYMEMRVEPFIQPVFDKYLSKEDNDIYLFNFHKRFTDSDSFSANCNTGIRKVCESLGLPKEKWYCCYTFRHT